MLLSHRLVALCLSSFSLIHALPDFSCICESHNLNACSKSYSCRLNSTIDFYKATVPDWVTDAEEALFVNTLDDAINGLLRPPFLSLGRMTWEATMACDDDKGDLAWYPQLSQCQATFTVDNVTEPRRRYHGWASLGFHPLGSQPGTWLTQIIGEIADAEGDDDSHLARARCANTGLYVSVDYINATQPYDPRFSPAGHWGMLYLYGNEHVYPVGAQGVPSYMTDGDLIDNGVYLNCTGYDTTGRVCAEPSCFEPANLTHYDCPAGKNTSVGAGNCARRYASTAGEDSGAVMGKGSVALVWVWIAGLLAVAVGFGT
ncbi:hypothetical protein BR93DRAFT_929644 [Coniochaeta sp. PMI_546]|nr:hypothetical protein BR93DRAFT_929644 [Coniochaeta sp. PMI_546]